MKPGLRLLLRLEANSALRHEHKGCKYKGTPDQVDAVTAKISQADHELRVVCAEHRSNSEFVQII